MALPVGNQFGVQFDAQIGSLGGDAFGSVVGRYFWRDPGRGLLGFYASETGWARFGGVHVTHIAPEFEVYWGRWTLRGLVGVEFGNSASRTTSNTTASIVNAPGGGGGGGVLTTTTITASTFTETYDVKTRLFDELSLKYYITDNWTGYAGHRYLGGRHALVVGSEYAVPMGGNRLASVFAEARVGQNAFEGIWAGARMYFGQKDKSLMQRHREDDPLPWDTLFSIVNSVSGTSNTTSSSSLFCPNGFVSPGVCESF